MAKAMIDKVRELYNENPKIHVDEIVKKLNITHDRAVTYMLWVLYENADKSKKNV